MCARVLHETIKKSNVIYINFGILEDYRLLYSSQVFCFPYYIYKLTKRYDDKEYCRRLDDKIQGIVRKYIGCDISSSYIKELQRLSRYYEIIDEFISNIKKRSSLLFYISDTDHLDTRSIACDIHKNDGIKTILIDHAINTFSQVNKQIYSDLYYCWGEYHDKQCRRMLANYHSAAKVLIIGNSVKRYVIIRPRCKGRWLYILPSFQHQTAFTLQRNVDRTISFISEIKAIAEKRYPKIEFVIKPHPVDNIDYSKIMNVPQVNGRLEKIMDDVELIFVEDSTTTIEALCYTVPMIYIANRKGENLLNFKGKAGIVLAKDTMMLSRCIKEALDQEIHVIRRQQIFEYHFGTYDPRWTKLSQSLNKYISPDQ